MDHSHKKSLLCAAFLSGLLVATGVQAADTALLSAPADGWASQAGGTVGGASAAAANIYTVSNRAQLLGAIANGGANPKIIKLVGTIDMSEGVPFSSHADQATRAAINLPSNTTLFGDGTSASIVNGYLNLSGVSQVILRNLKIVAPCDVAPTWDVGTSSWVSSFSAVTVSASNHVWIDHNTLTDAPVTNDTLAVESGAVKECHDGALDITNASDYVTVSYNLFSLHNKTSMVGASDSASGDNGHLTVTFSNNIFSNVTMRAPRVRFGQVHLFNNYFTGSKSHPVYPHSYSVGAGVAARILSNNNTFEVTGASVCDDVITNPNSSTAAGTFKDTGSILNSVALSGCALSNATVWTPPYAFTPRPTALVKGNALLQAGAGKLKTSLIGDGNTSSSSSVSSSSSSSSSLAAVTIHMLGDSTMTTYTEDRRPQYGWGEKLPMFVNANVTIRNWAAGGRSSRSFYYEAGKWNSAKAAIQAGDYVIIQFGHNDEKDAADYPTYGTYAYCSDGTTNGEGCSGGADSVDPALDKSEHSYYQFLKRYVTEIRSKGGIPILMTPIVRAYFSSGVITGNGMHNLTSVISGETYPRGNYPEAMKAVAAQYNVPLVDITSLTKALVESYGPAASASPNLYYPDSTHLNGLYATLVAKMAVDGMKSLNVLNDYFVSVTSLLANPASLAWGDAYVGDGPVQSITVSTFDLVPATGTVNLAAPQGYLLSTDQITWNTTLDLNYSNGALTSKVYVKFAPAAVQAYNGVINFTVAGAALGTVAVSGNGIAVPAGLSTYAFWKMNSNSLVGSSGGLVSVADASVVGLPVGSTANLAVNGTTVAVNRYNSTTSLAHDAAKYVQFAVSAPASGSFTVSSISAWMATSGGSNTRADIEYSTTADFSSSVRLNGVTPLSFVNGSMVQTTYGSLAITVPAGGTLYLRVFPWYTITATGKYLAISDVKIEGIAASGP